MDEIRDIIINIINKKERKRIKRIRKYCRYELCLCVNEGGCLILLEILNLLLIMEFCVLQNFHVYL